MVCYVHAMGSRDLSQRMPRAIEAFTWLLDEMSSLLNFLNKAMSIYSIWTASRFSRFRAHTRTHFTVMERVKLPISIRGRMHSLGTSSFHSGTHAPRLQPHAAVGQRCVSTNTVACAVAMATTTLS